MTGVNDPKLPVRPTSVRGQLRFWWRATRGAPYGAPKELFEKEKAVWGSVNVPSSTLVNIESFGSPLYYRHDPRAFEGYVLFPAKTKDHHHQVLKEGLKFKMKVKYEKSFEKDVFCAIWAWVNFGGIGSRTRRGCGAMYCADFAPENPALKNIIPWLKNKIAEYGLDRPLSTSTRDWPTLSRRILMGMTKNDPLEAWKYAVTPLKTFRQGVGIGRNEGGRAPNRPGRSFWPEPDTLRRVLRKNNPEHKPNPHIPDGFPRAALGLPIIFRFSGNPGAPDSELYPSEGRKRMGSLFILRPLKGRNGQSAPMAVCLNAPLPDAVELKGRPGSFAGNFIVNPAFADYPGSPMRNRSPSGNAVEAFIAYLKTQGFDEAKS